MRTSFGLSVLGLTRSVSLISFKLQNIDFYKWMQKKHNLILYLLNRNWKEVKIRLTNKCVNGNFLFNNNSIDCLLCLIDLKYRYYELYVSLISANLTFYFELESGLEFRLKGTSTNYVMCFWPSFTDCELEWGYIKCKTVHYIPL